MNGRMFDHLLKVIAAGVASLLQKDIGPLRMPHQSEGGRIQPFHQRVVRLLSQLHKLRGRAARNGDQHTAEKQCGPKIDNKVASRRHS